VIPLEQIIDVIPVVQMNGEKKDQPRVSWPVKCQSCGRIHTVVYSTGADVLAAIKVAEYWLPKTFHTGCTRRAIKR
jgi:hypothetical protein